MDIEARLARARERLQFIETPEYRRLLAGTIGADPDLVRGGAGQDPHPAR